MEQGGTGCIPDGAQEKYGKDQFGGTFAREERDDRKERLGLPHSDFLKRPTTARKAEKMLELGKKMVSMSLQWAGEEEGGDAGVLQALFSTILIKMKVRGRRKVMDI